MSATLALGLLLAAITLLAMARLWRRARAETWTPARRAASLLLQPLMALLLGLALLPPPRPAPREVLVVLSSPQPAPALAPGERLFALPEAGEVAGATPTPDLARLLRATPGALLRVLGEGLVARDREAARGWPLVFEPGEPPAGLVALDWPATVLAGAAIPVTGELAGWPGARVELRDPGGARLALATPDAAGRFVLQASAGAPGPLALGLRVLGADDQALLDQVLPVDVAAGAPHRVWLLAGAPGPELKYLRRWAMDAGLKVHTQMSLGAGITLGDGARAIGAATLADTDLLVLDERAWRSLGPRGRATVLAAVDEGLGLLLRFTGPLAAGEREELARRGLRVQPASGPRAVALPPALTPVAPAGERVPALSRWPGRLAVDAGTPLLSSADGEPLAAWRAHGRGRIGAWLLSDSFRWSLAGHAQAHGRLWADAVHALARPRAAPTLSLPRFGRVGERATLCGLAAGAAWLSPEGEETPLVIDPATGVAACAAAWPRSPGPHRVRSGGVEQAWPVLAADALPGLAARERRGATHALAAFAPGPDAGAVALPRQPGPRWPGWAAFLLVAALAWALERRRSTR